MRHSVIRIVSDNLAYAAAEILFLPGATLVDAEAEILPAEDGAGWQTRIAYEVSRQGKTHRIELTLRGEKPDELRKAVDYIKSVLGSRVRKPSGIMEQLQELRRQPGVNNIRIDEALERLFLELKSRRIGYMLPRNDYRAA